MYVLLALGTISFLLCFALTPVCRDLFLHLKLVDLPDGGRKSHKQAVPRIGGLPIVLSCAITFAFLYWFHSGRVYIQHGEVLKGVLPAAGVMFLVGFLDDIVQLRPLHKLLGQIVAASLAVGLGVRLNIHHLPPSMCIVLSVAWLICCTNAVNLIDGMDGLATGVSLLASLSVLGIAMIYGHVGLALVTAPLAGALLAFLRYNFSPATVFLGDCGSLTIGFLLGCFGLVWSQQAHSVVGLMAPLMALALPLTDVGLAIGRRFLRNVPIFQGDRGHIHHRVLDLGFSTRHTALILYGVCCAFASLAVLATVSNKALPFLVLLLILIVLGISRLGYTEFIAVAREALTIRTIRSAIRGTICVEDFYLALRSAHSIDACWEVLRAACRDLHFASAELEIHGVRYRETYFECEPDVASFGIELSLGEGSTLYLTRVSEEDAPRITMNVLHRLQSVMRDRIGELAAVASPVRSVTTAA
jgi:UDP-GlcNAc:undecaprenyl-phosphate/decaprenyl-phosphate GlcNAc-1-phosphate transferase